MSEQERYGQEPYEPQDPHAPYAPGYPSQGQQTHGYDPYTGVPHQQGYDPAAYPHPDQQQYPQQGYDQQQYHDPQHYQQPYAQPQYHDPQHYQQPYEQPRQPQAQPQQYQEPAAHPFPQQRVAEQSPVPPQDGPEAAGEDEEEFHTEQFAFVEEEDEQAEDVIDWLKFSESRSERRDERKRRGRARTIALVVVLALALVGGLGYLWQAGMLSGIGAPGPASLAAGAQKRDVIVVHLREVDSNNSSTALMVRNETTGSGTTILLPNSLSVSTDDGSTTLGKSVVDEGADPTRDALNTLLGAGIQGTWRLDTPYLEILVDAVGGISLNTDATVTSGGRTTVTAGKDQSLNGQAAVAYATYRAPGETPDRQLNRFGQVMQAVLAKMPSDSATATKIVDSMGAIPDPSLSDGQLGATLGELAGLAKTGHYSTTTLLVQADGTLSPQATSSVVKDVLGGTVKNTDTGGIPTVAVRDAGAGLKAANDAHVAVVNSGDTYVDGGTTAARATSQVLYGSASDASTAKELAKTLGLPAAEVAKGQGAANADITVVLGADYKPQSGTGG